MLTSLQNAKIKNLVKLRRRRQRDRQKLMLIDGARALQMALDNQFALDVIYFDEAQGAKHAELLRQARRQNIAAQAVSAAVFSKISYGNSPDSILGLAKQPPLSLDSLPDKPSWKLNSRPESARAQSNPASKQLSGRSTSAGEIPDNLPRSQNPLYIVVEGLEKPGNLGAILRSADAAGVDGLILCNPQTDVYNPNVIRASRGTFFSVPIAQATVEETLRWLRERAVQIVAADPESALRYTKVDMRPPTAIVLGAEHAGLSAAWRRQLCVTIPMRGQADSLNVAQSASILMFEALRQREEAATTSGTHLYDAPRAQ